MEESKQQPGKKREVDIPDCPVHSVVVYPDRAEVTRLVTVRLEEGDAEVVLKSLSKCLDKDSVRVDGIGPASITEVSYQEVAVTEEEDTQASASAEVVVLEERIAELGRSLEGMGRRVTRLEGQKDMLEKYSNGMFAAGEKSDGADLVSQKTVDGVFSYLETYEEKMLSLKVSEHSAKEEKEEGAKQLEELKKRLSDLKPKLTKPSEPVKQPVIGILLSVKEAAEIQLLVSYVVTNASWSPKYDLRVSSEERSMHVSYFGMVQQNTGEDWNDAKLSLSTATPSIGGSAPKLETARLTLVPNAFPHRGRSSSFKKKARHSYGFGEEAKAIEAPEAQVSEGLSSSVFEIATIATVPSDNSGHKVSIGTINLKPTFEYDTVPKLAQHAFLRARVKNDSRFPFLAGPANVFLDHSYVTETTLSSVSPGEEFSCSLGVDPSVRVVYKPVRRYREEGGLISKNVTYTYKQVTELTNTRKEPTVITFMDQVPKSQDEKLKVTLVEPNIHKQKTGAPPPNPKLNAQNNVEWRLDLNAEETRSITIHYTVEFPANKEVEGL